MNMARNALKKNLNFLKKTYKTKKKKKTDLELR